MELYILRHAQSTNNALADQRDRVADPALTGMGERQAELLAYQLVAGTDPADLPTITFGNGANGRHGPGYGISRLFCSPMRRSLQTAAPVARALGLAPEVWIDIHEHGGIYLEEETGFTGYGGMSRAEIMEGFPNFLLPETITEKGWWTGALEGEAERDERAIRVAARLHRWASSDERIAIISHGGFINGLLKILFNLPTGRMIFYRQYNAAISRIQFRQSGRLAVDYLNRADFMPPELLTI